MANNSDPGSFFNLGFNGTEMTDELRTFLLKNRPGGITLFKRNILNPDQLANLTTDIRDVLALEKPLICIDFEGGRVNRLKDFLPSVPTVRNIGLNWDETLPFHYGYISGRILSLFGIDVDFAPVVDLYSDDPTNGIGDRAYDKEPEKVKNWAKEYLSGLYEGGVIGCLKHFPGLFGSKVDSHLSLPEDKRSAEEFLSADLVPYKQRIECPHMVMIAHCRYPALFKNPAPSSLNPESYDLLRNGCGFDGVAVSDDLLMGALESEGNLFEISKKVLYAGADVALICNKMPEAAEAIEQFRKFCAENPQTDEKLDKASNRISELKMRSPLAAPKTFDIEEFEDLVLEMEDIFDQVTEDVSE
jgi:beta-N-acetylhexosaminidase